MTLHGAEINDVARRQILGLCDAVLIRAGVVGILPTPLDTVSAAAGIADIVDIGHVPARLVETKPSALKRILGAYLFREKVVFVDRAQTSSRVRFTQAHETGHNLIPWHERSFVLDDEEGLFRGTRDTLEAEASLAGAHLIFQGMRFFERALDVEVSVKAPMLLAPAYGASLHATIRYYCQGRVKFGSGTNLMVQDMFPW